MSKKIIAVAVLTMTTYIPFTQAYWKANVENDIFSNGKNAELIGDITNKNQSIIFDCTENELFVSQVEEDSTTAIKEKNDYQTLIKIGENVPVTFNTTLSRRNPESIQLRSGEEGKIKLVLKQLLTQTSGQDFLIGDIDGRGNHISSGSGSTSFSKKSVTRFISACKISL
ncbi:hypothetical protein [Klebsiella aerogenes]|uniref:hypothetical protein n=1 Tax=Klebsiella aerogenes TaxID=548 RepID=UPI0034D18BF9